MKLFSSLNAAAALLSAACLSASVHAAGGAATGSADGRLVDQSKVLNGSVTAGDAPGFPLTLTEPGLYKLMGNLTVTDPNADAVLITADHVTLDLNGFAIVGPVNCTGNGSTVNCAPNAAGGGVRATAARHVQVRGGSVRGFGTGVVVGALSRVDDMHVTRIGGNGIVAGPSSMLTRNMVSVALIGIQGAGLVRDNVVSGIRNVGVVVLAPGLAIGNAITGSGGTGLQLPSGTAGAYNLLTLNDNFPLVGQGLSLGDAMTNLCGDTIKC